MRKPKVLFIGPLPPPYSGPELSMKQFLESESLNNAFDIYFLQTNFRKSNKSKGKFGLGMVSSFFVFFTQLFWKLVTKRPKLVYYPITPTQIGWMGRDVWTILLSKCFRTKVVIHLRGSHFKLNFTLFSPKSKKLVGFALKKVDGAIVQADYLSDQFEPFVAAEKVHTLYQSMDANEFPLMEMTQRKLGKILIIGHLTKAKGYTDILKIIPAVADKFPEVSFCFAGEMRRGERGVFFNQYTNEKINYEDPFLAEQDLLHSSYAKNYQNLGVIAGYEKLRHLQTAQLFISASYSEGFSRALLEAMSTGTPLIYTPVGAHREVLGEQNGIAVSPGDIEGLIAAVLKMLNEPELEKFSTYNRLKVVSDFSVEKICFDFQQILTKTLS
jgi:glycosyltransferase involved in cell wall biosynthesis